MENTANVDLEQVARNVDLPIAKVQPTVELLDDGNTVPFITRYRKDQTGGLDEEQIRRVQESVARLRALADRKQRILKTLESQGKLTDELAERVNQADSVRCLEDLYQPFKSKKQTLANTARSRGLEPLACEILEGGPSVADLKARAEEFVSEENALPTVADVLQGAGHLIAERFSENLSLRDELRKTLRKAGVLASTRVEESAEPSQEDVAEQQPTTEPEPVPEDAGNEAPQAEQTEEAVETHTPESSEAEPAELVEPESVPVETEAPDAETALDPQSEEPPPTSSDDSVAAKPIPTESDAAEQSASPEQPAVSDEAVPPDESAAPEQPDPTTEDAPSAEEEAPPASEPAASAEGTQATDQATEEPPAAPAATGKAKPKLTVKQIAAQQRKEAKKRKRQKKIESFKDYFDFREPLSQIPPHRLLALNRGERSKILRVRIDADMDAMVSKAGQMLVPTNHPHSEFLGNCLRDALTRMVVPSLERDVRRELTEKAEAHAVHVFARNLRKLLLQPPVRSRRVLAVDPGFRSGCKLAALDEFGNVLGHTVIHVIGKSDVVRRGRQQIVEMITLYHIPVIAIGNGAACRESEKLIADILAKELARFDVQYVTVNEAGASVYSTSALGREELPRFDPVLRSAVSIGRRLQDPLSELVKINPANIGVGLYQHDVKAKHLETSLDAVVESCVNFVAVDVNTASPALLRYVSGLNQLTARRLYEYRQQNGPFRNRNQFKEVPGFGDATFVQAAGFLKITGGDNPLDATWIHPESYEVAGRVIEELGGSVSELAASVASSQQPEKVDTVEEKPQQKSVAKIEPPTQEPADEKPAKAEQESEESAETPKEQSTETEEKPEEATEPPQEQPPETEEELGEAAEPAKEEPPKEEPTEAEEKPEESATPAEQPQAVPEEMPPEPAEVAAAVENPPSLAERAGNTDVAALAAKLEIGELLLKDILSSLTRPGRDPREDLPPPMFRREVMKLEDLQPEMELSGTVLNVVDFGAFVDIGLPDSGLIHISRLADRYVRDPHEVVSVGDIVNVWVVEVDKQRRRVSLTAIKPGTETPREERQDRPKSGGRERKPRRPEGKPYGRRPEGRQQGKRDKGGKPKYVHRQTQKKKPVRPITDKMVEGKEPMRSFSDLLQFYERKPTDEEEKEKS